MSTDVTNIDVQFKVPARKKVFVSVPSVNGAYIE